MKLSRLIYGSLLMYLSACNNPEVPVKITGDVEYADTGVIRIINPDTVFLAENLNMGKFGLEGNVPAAGFYSIELLIDGKPEQNAQHLIYLDKNPVQISYTKLNDLYPLVISRSAIQKDLNSYHEQLEQATAKAETQHRIAQRIRDETGEGISAKQYAENINRLTSAEQKLNKVPEETGRKFITENPGSLVSAYLLSSLVTDIEQNPQLYTDLFEKLSAENKKTKYAIQAEKSINKQIKSGIGSKLPPIYGTMPDNKPFDPKLLEGKITLIIFWASWNTPSKGDMDNLKTIYQEFHADGFEILAISLDKDPEKWKASITENRLTWYHVSDFKGANSANIESLNNNRLPYYMLVDRQLRIAERDLPISSVPLYIKDLME